MAENAELGDLRACPECEALNPPGAKFCAECGCLIPKARPAAPRADADADAAAAPVGGPPPLPGATPTAATAATGARAAGRRRSRAAGGGRSADAVEKSRARQEFARIKNIVVTVRMVYVVSAAGAGVNVLLWHVLLVPTMRVLLGEGFDVWWWPLTIGLYLQLGLMTAGALLVLRSPLIWTVVGACAWTLQNAMQWWFVFECLAINEKIERFGAPFEPIEVGMNIVFASFWTLMVAAFWFAAAQAARVQRLMAENPELQIVRQRFDPNDRVDGGVGDKVRRRRNVEGGNQAKTILRVGGVVIAGLSVLVVALWVGSLPPAVDDAVARFETAWRTADIEALEGQLARGSLREDLVRHGWDAGTPTLGGRAIEDGGDDVIVTWSCAGDEVVARFALVEDAWQLQSLAVPPLDPPAIEPALQRYSEAWQQPGIDALIEQFRPDLRQRFGASLRRMFDKRDWLQARPALGDVDPGRVRNGDCMVLFGIGFDELKLKFEYWHPQWHVTGVIPPR